MGGIVDKVFSFIDPEPPQRSVVPEAPPPLPAPAAPAEAPPDAVAAEAAITTRKAADADRRAQEDADRQNKKKGRAAALYFGSKGAGKPATAAKTLLGE